MKIHFCFALIAAAVFLQVAEGAVLEHNEAYTKKTIEFCAASNMYFLALYSILPCGYKPLDIPVYVPFHKDHFNLSFLNVAASISQFSLYGLEDFKAVNYDCNSNTNDISFDILFPKLQAVAQYDVGGKTNLSYLPFELGGNGLFDATIYNLRAVGHIHWKSPQSLEITDFKFNFSVESFKYNNLSYFLSDLFNNLLNNWANDFSKVLTQEVQKYIDMLTSLYFLPYVNNELRDVSIDQASDFFVLRAMYFRASNCHRK